MRTCRSARARPGGSPRWSAAGPMASRSPTSPAGASSGALDFAVDRSALVPRPETETVVEAVLAHAARLAARPRLLDLGTGSGCLLVALLSELRGAVGLGVDVSPAAVSLARVNARRHGVSGRASFAVADWGAPLDTRFDIVVSNPPYVAASAFASLAPEVARHEPRAALAGGADGYACYRRLAPQIARLLAPAGLAAVELGAGMADETASLFAAAGLVEIGRRRDLAGIDRCALFAHGAVAESLSERKIARPPDVAARKKMLQTAPSRLGSAGLAKRGRSNGLVEFPSDRSWQACPEATQSERGA